MYLIPEKHCYKTGEVSRRLSGIQQAESKSQSHRAGRSQKGSLFAQGWAAGWTGEALSRLLPTTARSGLLRHVTEKQRSSAAQASRRRWVPVRSRKRGPDGSPEHGPLATLEAGGFEGPEAIRLKFTPHLCARDRLPMDKSVLTSLSEDTARHVRRDRVTKFWPVECGLDPRNCPHNHLSLSAGLTSGVRQGPGG